MYFFGAQFKSKTATVQTTDGFEILVEPNDLIGRHIYLTGEFDRSIVEVLCKFSEPGDVLLDIGANIGYVSTCFLNNVPRSSVIAVEPQPGILDILKTNLDRFGRYQLYPYALGNTDGEVFFSVNADNKGGSQVSDTGTIKVEMRSAARMFRDLNIDKLDLVKLDTEGCEEIILRDCASELEKLQPRAILFEELGKSGVRDILSGIRYRVFGIRKLLHKLELHPADLTSNFHDYIALSRKRPIPSAVMSTYKLTIEI
jgi:FkbM family methyltransferase